MRLNRAERSIAYSSSGRFSVEPRDIFLAVFIFLQHYIGIDVASQLRKCEGSNRK